MGSDAHRRAVERRARLELAIERYRSEQLALRETLPALRGQAGPGRRLLAVVVGSRPFHRLASRRKAGPVLPAGTGSPEVDEEATPIGALATDWAAERDAYHRLARRRAAYEGGLVPSLRSLARVTGLEGRARRAPPRLAAGIPLRSAARRLGTGPAVALLVDAPAWRGWMDAWRLARRTSYGNLRVELVPRIRGRGDQLARALSRCDEELVAVCRPFPPERPDWLDALVRRLHADPGLGAVADRGWSFDWRCGAPWPVSDGSLTPAAVAGSCVVARRSLVHPETVAAYSGPLWAFELSVDLAQSGLGVAVEKVGAVDTLSVPAPDMDGLVRRRGPALRRRILADLLRGGGRWCRRAARIRADESVVQRHCRALGWTTTDDRADFALRLTSAGRLAVDWIPGTDAAPALLETLSDPEQLRTALLGALAAPTFCMWIPARDREAALRSGDYALAVALAGELAERGHQALVQPLSEAGDRPGACLDVLVAIRGRRLRPPDPGQLSVLWLISHPEDVADSEFALYDGVLVASRPHAAHLERRLGVPVAPMLQFTDAQRFRPRPDAGPGHRLLFVGNWRGEFRRAVWDALAAGLEPALYGEGWRRLEPERAVADHVANEELPALYSSCEVLLADHWEDMQEHGFIANRIFDALACEAFVIAERFPALEAELPGGIETYSGAEELRRKVDHYLARPDERREVARTGRALVLERHTSEHRAEQLLAAIEAAANGCERPAVAHLREAGPPPEREARPAR